MIKNKEEFKNYNIVCINKKEVQKTMDFLKNLNFEVEDMTSIQKDYIIVMFDKQNNKFVYDNWCKLCYKNISFYNFKKLAKNLLKKEEKEKKLEDFEVASDGRIIKVNNWRSEKIIYGINQSCRICETVYLETWQNAIDCGLIFATEEARDKAVFRMKIENQLKNIAERLNNREKIDWNNVNQKKYYIYFLFENFENGEWELDWHWENMTKIQSNIHCLSNKFLKEAIKEIGEENLIKYFKD